MVTLTVYDAAGPTTEAPFVDFPEIEIVSVSRSRIRGEGTILDGPYAGDTLRTDLLGSFDPLRETGEVDAFRFFIAGERHYDLVFDSPIDVEASSAFADIFEGPVTVRGNAFRNEIGGGPADDALFGGGGADRLRGLGSDDRLFGGAGADRLIGGLGRDRLDGGTGADRFEFRTIAEAGRGATRDILRDFGEGADFIDLALIDAREDRDGNQTFRFVGADAFSGRAGELRAKGDLVMGDVDGDARSDFHIELANAAALRAGDFAL